MSNSTTSKKILAQIEEMEKLQARMKADGERFASIKAELKTEMLERDTKVLNAGDYVLIISERVRTDLDKVKVQSLLGEKYEECIKKSPYQIFEIKKS